MKKVLIHIIGATIILGVGASLFVLVINSEGFFHNMLRDVLHSRGALLGFFVCCMMFYIDALKRKTPYAFLWFLVMFVFPIVGILLYIKNRPPMPESTSGERRAQLCPHCGKYFEPPVTFCPHCGARI
ncbi:MAG: PLDc N-terminal domain-containing protein [Selenomonadaceae bacterium]|nr:PLDc N-terminal domain-containing protein [Selenomonadaceae bacterium]